MGVECFVTACAAAEKFPGNWASISQAPVAELGETKQAARLPVSSGVIFSLSLCPPSWAKPV